MKYPDQNGLKFDSNLIEEKDLKPGDMRLLSVDNPLVVPVGATVRVQVTGIPEAVIHSCHALVRGSGIGRPGRLNESWFRVTAAGAPYYGECNQDLRRQPLRMPIEVKAVGKAGFRQVLAEAKRNSPARRPEGARLAAAKRRPGGRIPIAKREAMAYQDAHGAGGEHAAHDLARASSSAGWPRPTTRTSAPSIYAGGLAAFSAASCRSSCARN